MAELTIDEKLAAQGVTLSNASEEEKQAVLAALDKGNAAIAEQAAKVAELEANVSELNAQLEAAVVEIKNAQAIVQAEAAKPKAVSGFGEVVIEKKRYEITAPAVIVPGKGKVTAAQIQTDKEVQTYLLGIGCGTLKELK